MPLHEQGGKLDHRLRMLDTADQEEEPGLLSEAYGRLISAYRESRELNEDRKSVV